MAKREILDRSKTYLDIFTRDVEIDYNLPKYEILKTRISETVQKDVTESGSVDKAVKAYLGIGRDMPNPVDKIPVYNGEEKRKAWILDAEGHEVNREFFDSLTADDLTILLDEKKATGMRTKFMTPDFMNTISFGSLEGEMDDTVIRVQQRIVDKQKPGFLNKLLGRKYQVLEVFNPETGEVYDPSRAPLPGSVVKKKKEETYEMDVLKFFDAVKLESTKETEDYYDRIGPFLVALKKAKQMGQTTLVDQFLSKIFIAKYESLLRAKGFHHKISEFQLVNFVKKTEKGVSLTYVKNFSRPIPDDVLAKKLEADQLHIFDNYVVLHYDPEGKVYAETAEEAEKTRAKKSDPILFGLIAESRELYYITDWKDEWCDLTLEKFLEVSGLIKENLEIDEKIKI